MMPRTAGQARQQSDVDDVEHLLSVEELRVELTSDGRLTRVVDAVSLHVDAGEVVGLVGESGCGKSVTAKALMGLLPPRSSRVRAERLDFAGRGLLELAPGEFNSLRGKDMSMVFQDPMASLNPSFTVGEQIAESLRHHLRLGRRAAWDEAVALLDRVHISQPRERAKQYPHMLSGGMRQRAMIAISLACQPRLLIADEPTTALDVTIQAGILELLAELRSEMDLAVLLITHDLGVAAEICDRAMVMYLGEVVEQAPVTPLFDRPRHPYTEGLMRSLPQSLTERGADFFSIPGSVPPSLEGIEGCRFAARCEYADEDRCAQAIDLVTEDDRAVRCVRRDELELRGTR